MAKYNIVVHDPELELTQSQRRGHKHEKRQKGYIHVSAIDEACPLGHLNCRNCGDPNYVDSCRAAGHCPDCGTKHGIAPDAILTANGYRLDII